jgi:hypothetical protein
MAKRLLQVHEFGFHVAYEQLCIEGVFFLKAASHLLCEVHSTIMRASGGSCSIRRPNILYLLQLLRFFYNISEDVQGFTGSGINTQSAI